MENEKDNEQKTEYEDDAQILRDDDAEDGFDEDAESGEDLGDDFFGLSEIDPEPEESTDTPQSDGEEPGTPPDDSEKSEKSGQESGDGASGQSADNTGKPDAADFGKRAEDDLAELVSIYPALADLGSLRDLPNARRFGELRDLGLSVREAFLASSGDELVRRAEAHGASKESSKAHLTAVSRRSAAANDVKMSAKERETFREFFGEDEMSDEELDALFAKTKK